MPLTITHPFVLSIPNDPNSIAAGEAVPSNWNAAHNVSGNLPVTQLNNGTNANVGSFWRGDGVWAGGITVFNVKNFGATGDGVTDDTTAINAAIAAFNTATKGVLYFPAGTYKVTSSLTTITAMGIITGDGSAQGFDQKAGTSIILYTSNSTPCMQLKPTANVVEAGAGGAVKISDLAIYYDTDGSSTPVAGCVGLTNLDQAQNSKVDYENLVVDGFYDNIDTQNGANWSMAGCMSGRPIHWAMRIRSLVLADAGDWSISGSQFFGHQNVGVVSAALIRIESSGGGKIVNCKFNGTQGFTGTTNMIDVVPVNHTVDLLVSNCSFEDWVGIAINVDCSGGQTYENVVITGNEFDTQNAVSCIGIKNDEVIAIVGNLMRGNYSSSAINLSTVAQILIGNNNLVDCNTPHIVGTPDIDATGGIGGEQFFIYNSGGLTWTGPSGSFFAILDATCPNAANAAFVAATNNNNKSVALVAYGTGAGGTASRGYLQSDNPLYISSDPNFGANGGADPIIMSPGGYDAESVRFLSAGNVQFTHAANFSTNASVATVLGSVGPSGSRTTVQKWLTIKDGSGNPFYIPCF